MLCDVGSPRTLSPAIHYIATGRLPPGQPDVWRNGWSLGQLGATTATDRKTLETLTETVATLTLQLKEKKKDTVIKNLNNQIKQLKTGNNDAAADGWYLGPAMHHYWCYGCYIPARRSERVSNTVDFSHTTIQCYPKLTRLTALPWQPNNSLMHWLPHINSLRTCILPIRACKLCKN